MNTLSDRLEYLMKEKGVTPYALSKKTGVSQAVFSRIKNKNSKPNESNLKAICDYFNVTEEWLLTGNLSNQTQEPVGAYNIKNDNAVPYYDVDFTASFVGVENTQKTVPDTYVTHPFFKGCDYIVRASGQSMAKIIKHGDAIGLIEISNWHEFIPLGEVYAIVTKNGFRMIKVVTKGSDDNHYTLLSKPSDSKRDEFPPQEINKNMILKIFRVQASSHLF